MNLFWIPLLCALVGVLLFALATHSKIAEIGKIMFFVGLLVVVMAYGGQALRLH